MFSRSIEMYHWESTLNNIMELSSGCEKLKTATCDKFETFARLCITSNQFIVLNCLLDAIII